MGENRIKKENTIKSDNHSKLEQSFYISLDLKILKKVMMRSMLRGYTIPKSKKKNLQSFK